MRFHKSRMAGYELSAAVNSKCLKSNLHTGPGCLTSGEWRLEGFVSLSIKRELCNVLLRSCSLPDPSSTVLGRCLVPGTSVTIPARGATAEPSNASETAHKTGFSPRSSSEFRTQNRLPRPFHGGTTTFPGDGPYSCIAIVRMKRQLRFQGDILKFGESLKQGQPRVRCQNSNSTNVVDTHDCFPAAWKCVLCCFFDEHSTHSSHSTSTATGPQM